ncbi:acyltransferase [Natronomonas sp.]|uniref:acyltransferase n=1 Tax=Natronomonas sp. TaxID=2184060 RepID=UPI0026055AFB|nr:acyltransferase [Natronomonas sp.]
MTKRHVDVSAATQASIDAAIEYADDRLSSDDPTGAVVQELLVDAFGDRPAYERYLAGETLDPMTRMRIESYDPRNAVTETEHWAEQDPDKLEASKPLRYLWEGFDRSPLSNNVAFALPFRQLLADHLFSEAGDDLRLFGGIKIQCGSNIEMGDNVVVHNDVLLDDRGELVIGDRVSIADRAHLHTHNHDLVDQTDVTTYRTTVEDDARLGYGSMVNAGCRVGENAMVGASASVLGDVPAHHVAVGAPAKSVKIKPGWEDAAETLGPLADNREDRRLGRELPADFEEFDEFGRSLSPPGTSS